MRYLRAGLLLLAGVLAAGGTLAQGGNRAYIGTIYPAGGRQGTTVALTINGQNLRDPQGAYVTGRGVQAKITGYEGPMGPLNRQQQDVLQRKIRDILTSRFGQAPNAPKPPAAADPPPADVPLPDLPELRNLTQKTPRELKLIADRFCNPNKRPKPPLAETVFVEATIARDAPAGDHELRIGGAAGLSSPVCFQVSQMPELLEQEAEEREPEIIASTEVPVMINGHIMPGDVDRFRLRLRKGQHLVVAAAARRLIPYLADAVPGWFQAALSLRDPEGKEIAFADHYRYDQDPVLFASVPADGEYLLEIRDSIYRGRLDFVYRVSAAEAPFITSWFPLGGRAGAALSAVLSGVNLSYTSVPLDMGSEGEPVRHGSWPMADLYTNEVAYQVSDLPEVLEAEPNNTAQKAQHVSLPQVINGRIGAVEDTDVYRFEGKAGQQVVAEVWARRLGSPLDALLRLTDAAGKTLALSDDQPAKAGGLQTHHADSYLTARLPAAGAYCVSLGDAARQGGEDYGYRLRVSEPRADFALRVTPSSLNIPPGRICLVEVFALRQDGYAGPIDLSVSEVPAPLGPGAGAGRFALTGGRIPAGCDRLRVTLTAPPERLERPVELQITGTAQVGERVVRRRAVPADDMMQAFAYHHLVPAQALLVGAVGPGSRAYSPTYQLPAEPVRLVSGAVSLIPIATVAGMALPPALELTLSDPPKGLSLQEVKKVPEGVALAVKVAADAPKIGYQDNLIVQVAANTEVRGADGKATGRRWRYQLGVLPAVPFEIVKQ